MILTKELLEARLQQLQEEVAQQLAELNATIGRKAEMESTLAVLAQEQDVRELSND